MRDIRSGGVAVWDPLSQFASPLQYATVTVTAVVLLLGVYIGYQAYRGYRRNDDRSVLYLGVGVFLVTTGRQVASSLSYLAVGENELLLVTMFFTLSIAGLVSVLYAFLQS